MKTSKGLVEYCKAQLGKPYWYGTFGHKASESLLRQKSAQYPEYYKDNDFIEQYGQKVHDCSGLIKGYLFCDSPEEFYKTYTAEIDGGIRYNNCTEKGDITSIPDLPGVLVFMPGHVGVYVGKGKVIEARGHEYGVVETNLVGRGWKQWGKCPYIEYSQKDLTREEKIELVKNKVGYDDNTCRYIFEYYKYGAEALDKLVTALGGKI